MIHVERVIGNVRQKYNPPCLYNMLLKGKVAALLFIVSSVYVVLYVMYVNLLSLLIEVRIVMYLLDVMTNFASEKELSLY